jgi:hypothetical protein
MATNNAADLPTGALGTIPRGAGIGSALVFTTATYPATTTANQVLYSSADNIVGGIATSANAVLVTTAGSVPQMSSSLPTAVQQNIINTGTIVVGNWGATPVPVANGGTGAATAAAARGNLAIPFSNLTVFTSTGTFTPDANTSRVYVKVFGGGGGGGGGGAAIPGAGGAAGGYSEGFVTVTPSVGVTVTVGAGGAGGVTTGNGAAGSASSFAGGSTLTANGGAAGTNSGGASSGGTATGGTFNVAGQDGQSSTGSLGGAGGGNFGGGGGGVSGGTTGTAPTAPVYGNGGGGGGASAGNAGGAGSNGLVLVYY